MFNSVALFVAIAVALCSTADFLYHRSRKKTKRPEALAERAKQRRHLSLRGGSPVGFRYKKKNPSLKSWGSKERRRTEPEGRTRRSIKKKNPSLKSWGSKERRRHTLPQIAVPSAQAGLTSLFGMGRGEPRRNNHLKVVVT